VRPKRRRSLAAGAAAAAAADARMVADEAGAPALDACEEESMVYELFSVMVHSGSAFGGHYYAYIKDLATGKWYKFNDATVTLASWADVESTFGGSSSGYSYISSSATAYMLLYRKRDPALNAFCVDDSAVPKELREALEQRDKAEAREHEAERIKRNSITLTVFHTAREVPVVVPKRLTLHEVKDHVRSALPELAGVCDDCLRLRKYVLDKDIVSTVLGCGDGEAQDHDRAVQALEYDTTVVLETRPATLPPWPPATTDSQCAVKVWASRELKAARHAAHSSGTCRSCLSCRKRVRVRRRRDVRPREAAESKSKKKEKCRTTT